MLQDKINDIEDINPDPIDQEEVNSDYQFVSGHIDPDDSLEEFLDEFRKPKEETGAAEQPEDDEFYEENAEEVDSDAAKYTADFIVTSTDEIIARILSFISKNDPDEYRAGKEQKKHFKKLWTHYCQEKQIDLPVGVQIIISMASVYGPMTLMAFNERKVNLKLEALKEDQERLNTEREMFRHEKENFERNKHNADKNGK